MIDLERGELELLSGCLLFKGADPSLISRALKDERCRLIELNKGEIIFEVFDYRKSLGLILSGCIEVTKPSSSRYSMNMLEKGGLFGSADLYNEDAGVVTVLTAASNCRILFFPLGLLEELVRRDSTVALNYIRFLTGRIRFLNEKIFGLVSESALASLSHYLVQNAVPCGAKLIVRTSGSITALAEQLNIGRASLYRAFNALEHGGLIKKNGREIEIIRLDGLTNTD